MPMSLAILKAKYVETIRKNTKDPELAMEINLLKVLLVGAKVGGWSMVEIDN